MEAGNYKAAIQHLEAGIDTAAGAEKLDRLGQIASLAAGVGGCGEGISCEAIGSRSSRAGALAGRNGDAVNSPRRRNDRENSRSWRSEWSAEAEKSPSAAGIRRLVVLYMVSGIPNRSAKWLNKAVTFDGEDTQALAELSTLEMARGDIDKALALRKTVTGLRPGDPDVRYWNSPESRRRAGGFQDAEKTIEASLASQPEEPRLAERAMDFYAEYHLNEPLEKRLRAADLTRIDATEALATFLIGAKRFPRRRKWLGNSAMHHSSPAEAAAAHLRPGNSSASAGMTAEAGEAYAQGVRKRSTKHRKPRSRSPRISTTRAGATRRRHSRKSAALQPLPPRATRPAAL